MDYSNFTKYDLKEPYDILTEELELEDIQKLQQTFNGEQCSFPKKIKNKEGCEIYQRLLNCLGEKKAIFVMKQYSGSNIYFSNIEQGFKEKKRKLIIKEFDGYNYRVLAKKYSCSERHIRRIIKDSLKEHKQEE